MNFKICAVCGRKMNFRKAWAKNWLEVKYCSERCRRSKNKLDFQEIILQKLRELSAASERRPVAAAEFLEPDKRLDSDSVERVRSSARKLALEGLIEILQDGRVVDPTTFRGPIQIRLKK
jgi:hypothetical protein